MIFNKYFKNVLNRAKNSILSGKKFWQTFGASLRTVIYRVAFAYGILETR